MGVLRRFGFVLVGVFVFLCLGGGGAVSQAATGDPPTAYINPQGQAQSSAQLDLFHSSVGQATTTISFDSYATAPPNGTGGASSCAWTSLPQIPNPFTVDGVEFSTDGCLLINTTVTSWIGGSAQWTGLFPGGYGGDPVPLTLTLPANTCGIGFFPQNDGDIQGSVLKAVATTTNGASTQAWSFPDSGSPGHGESYFLGFSSADGIASVVFLYDGTAAPFINPIELVACPAATVTDLGTLGGETSEAIAVNAGGQIVGYSDITGDAATHAFSWTQAGGMVDLGTLGGTASKAQAVNGSGRVVGYSQLAGNTATHAFSWTQAGGMVDLGTLGGSMSQALAVNASGQVVGWSYVTGDTAAHAFSWTQAGGMVDLGTLGGSNSNMACCLGHNVNDSGQAVGQSDTSGAGPHAFLWSQGAMIDLGVTTGGTASWAYAVNGNGQVVGQSTGTGVSHGFSWTQAGGMVDLGQGWANAVNGSGQVVGVSYANVDNAQRASSWTQAGGMVDLGTLGGSRSQALAINTSGQVVGISRTGGDSAQRGFLWTPAGGMVDLGTLGGSDSAVNAMNDSGWVVGSSNLTGDAASHATLWKVITSVAPPADANGDGVVDSLQPSGTPAHAFVDASLTPQTTGTVVSGSVTVVDDTDPAKGVRVTASTDAVLSVCAGPDTLTVPAGMAVTVTCGSVIVQNVTGTGTITVTTPGGAVSVAFQQGESGEVSDNGTVAVFAGSSGPVTVTEDGVATDVAAGKTATFNGWDFTGLPSRWTTRPGTRS